ncbi:hypothetical protein ABZ498_06435 [Streptomyces lavendulocolor]|uniref:hypothetical protein n=1 Tax=Streptomyces lavendulocolor TaxID=67316 RepID=UPI0033DD46D8
MNTVPTAPPRVQLNASQLVPTVEHVIAAPLPQLLAEQNARLVDITSVQEPWFYGQLIKKRSGALILAMPVGQDPTERDAAARLLIAHFHGLAEDLFPAHMTATTVVNNGEDVL